MSKEVYFVISGGELRHWGVKGMKWGVRKKASEYYKNEAEKRTASSKARIDEINKTLSSNKKLSVNDTDKLFRELAAIESSCRHLKTRSEEITKNSKVGKRYVYEYLNNVSVDKLLKAYSPEYAYYQYNFKGDKEWLLNWDDKTGPRFN